MTTSAAELKVIERIQKMHRMAESAREVGNLAEAESFLEGIAKTLAAHNLEQSVLSLDLREATDPLDMEGCYGASERGRKKPQDWALHLSHYVAYAHFAATNYHVKSSYVWFYGRRSNVQLARKMYLYLRDMAEREGMKAWRSRRRVTLAVYGAHVPGVDDIGWYLAWLEGFAREVGSRYATMRARVESDKGMAVVLVSARKEAEDFSKSRLRPPAEDEELPDIAKGGRHDDARQDGARVAQQANLRPASLDGAAHSKNRQLTGGN